MRNLAMPSAIPRTLGQEGFFKNIFGVDLTKVGPAVGSGVGGIAAIALGRYMPKPIDTVSVLGGVALLGYSAWNLLELFSPTKGPWVPGTKWDPSQGSANYPNIGPGEASDIQVVITRPAQDTETYASIFEDTFSVTGKIYNHGKEDRNVTLYLEVRDDEGNTNGVTVTPPAPSRVWNAFEAEVPIVQSGNLFGGLWLNQYLTVWKTTEAGRIGSVPIYYRLV